VLADFAHLDGLIPFNDETMLGTLEAIDEVKLGGEMKLVSRNGSPQAVAAIRAGRSHGTWISTLPGGAAVGGWSHACWLRQRKGCWLCPPRTSDHERERRYRRSSVCRTRPQEGLEVNLFKGVSLLIPLYKVQRHCPTDGRRSFSGPLKQRAESLGYSAG
jgi:hypothetical protein